MENNSKDVSKYTSHKEIQKFIVETNITEE